MARSRTVPSASRLAAMTSRPGADPRVWLTQATVTEVGYDPEAGLFADVETKPDNDRLTCLIGSSFVGNNYGSYSPVQVGDYVLVAIPNGEMEEPPVIVSRMWSSWLKPPPEIAQDDDPMTDDPTAHPTVRAQDGGKVRLVGRNGAELLVEVSDGASFHVTASNGASVKIEATGGSTVSVTSDVSVTQDAPRMKLGNNATLGIARLSDTVDANALMKTWISLVSAFINGLAPGSILPPQIPVKSIGVVSSASTKGVCE